jgi:arylsulfatase A-like enzyme
VLTLALGTALAANGDVGLDFVAPSAIEVPLSTLGEVPTEIPLEGPFRLVGVVNGVRTYEVASPVRPRALYYERQPLGMELRRRSRTMIYSAEPFDRASAGTWEANAGSIMMRVRPESARPEDSAYTLTYPPATEREEALRFRGGDAAAWAIRSAQVDEVTRHGVLLPSGAHIAWTLAAHEGAHLKFEVAVLPPEIDEGARSDGASLTVKLGDTVVHEGRVQADTPFQAVDIVLPTVPEGATLTMAVADDEPALDHVFVASPTVYTPSDTPRRIVLAFIDTLRRDHLPTYGYERASAPKLEAWAEEAVVFEDARTTAPWTLPSTRALWTGRQPESWSRAVTTQELLRQRGWATGAFVGNVYLSSNFDMERGWGEHGCVNWPGAAYETRRAREYLRRNAHQDALLLVHFMDLHLPWKEPARYRHLWARQDPSGLRQLFNRTMLLRVAAHQRELIRPYLLDRYDQNLRYVDDELSALLGDLGDEATVFLFADHGEEFFDHGDLEHGHTLYDELLRVPLIVKSPGLAARRVSGSVSLMDVAPTLLDLAGYSPDLLGEGVEGRSLLTLAKGSPDPSVTERDLALGRVLYGPVQWGSLRGAEKYISTKGKEQLFDLAKDPGETNDLAAQGGSVTSGRIALAKGTGRDVMQAIRISPLSRAGREIQVDVHVPGGVANAWVGDDPTSTTLAEITSIEGEFVHLRFESRMRENREIFVVPNRPADEVVGEIGLKILGKGATFERLRALPHDGSGAALSRARSGSTALDVTWAVVPLPAGDELVGSDAELAGALEALGYATGAQAGGDEGGKGDEGDDDDDTEPSKAPAAGTD